MEKQFEIVSQTEELNNSLTIVELEERLEMAAAERCSNRCNGNDVEVTAEL
ncbi:MAG: hypothetical protein MUF58_10215 [Arcicella sp.]|nr:hypothetical protein [Arcicella sp.]